MTEMVERGARGVWESESPDIRRRYDLSSGDLVACSWEEADDIIKEIYRRRARATIAAIREPTEGMIDHLGDAMGDTPQDHENARELWREAIDKALGVDAALGGEG